MALSCLRWSFAAIVRLSINHNVLSEHTPFRYSIQPFLANGYFNQNKKKEVENHYYDVESKHTYKSFTFVRLLTMAGQQCNNENIIPRPRFFSSLATTDIHHNIYITLPVTHFGYSLKALKQVLSRRRLQRFSVSHSSFIHSHPLHHPSFHCSHSLWRIISCRCFSIMLSDGWMAQESSNYFLTVNGFFFCHFFFIHLPSSSSSMLDTYFFPVCFAFVLPTAFTIEGLKRLLDLKQEEQRSLAPTKRDVSVLFFLFFYFVRCCSLRNPKIVAPGAIIDIFL